MPVCYPHQGRCHLRRGKTLGHLIATATAATLGARYRSVRHPWRCGGEQGPRSSCRVATNVEVHLCHRPIRIGRDGERERENGREETVETYTHGRWRRRGLALRWHGASSCRRPCLGRTARGALSSRRIHVGLEREDGEVVLFFYEEWGEREMLSGSQRGMLLATQRESANQAKMDQWVGEEVRWH